MNKWFVIRCDADQLIGLGHFMRCFALAETLSIYGYKAIFIMRSPSAFCVEKVQSINGLIINLKVQTIEMNNGRYPHSSWLPWSELTDASKCLFHIEELILQYSIRPQFIIVDHYAIGAEWELKLYDFGKIVVIDDLSDRPHYCHILIDQTYGKSASCYDGLVNVSAKLLVGTSYSILRQEFIKERSYVNRINSSIRNILITLGGVDSSNFTSTLLDGLLSFEDNWKYNFNVLVSELNPNINLLKKYKQEHTNVNIFLNPSNMAEIMRQSDLCFGAVGSTTWERFAMSLPSVLCVIAENQMNAAKNLEKDNLVKVIDINSDISASLLDSFKYYLEPNNYTQNVASISNLVDCLGVSRIISEIFSENVYE